MIRRTLILLSLLVLTISIVLAAEPTVEKQEIVVPEVVGEAIRAAVGSQALVVSAGEAEIANIWLRGELQSAGNPSTELGVSFGSIEAGSLVGVIQILGQWSDYKMNPIPAGTYTLRYGVMPADGNHMGVSTYRDFLMLIDPSADTDPASALDMVELLTGSSQASGVPHPAVLALFPIWDDVSEPVIVKNDMDQWTLAVKLGDKVLGLVVEGHGEIH
ncbi:MAG: hypothetical protein JSU96_21145 [Acidobacteriota bacterium]|nr:MAG: hypothetical protein JSU96_21145 [Acidobacteriota bacterium]